MLSAKPQRALLLKVAEQLCSKAELWRSLFTEEQALAYTDNARERSALKGDGAGLPKGRLPKGQWQSQSQYLQL
ncbi:MAG: hypothetical protein KME30_02460 [Iphinoe sp. HA4291-MV1]|jgi:hypothetical protein|nr:hypothetical protein [Iphinoe sp. HA4291-MV1]